MSNRNIGDVFYSKPVPAIASATATTSGGVVILSVNTSGASEFAVSNPGSINIYIEGSFNGSFFQTSIASRRQTGVAGAPTSTVDCVSASTVTLFDGLYVAVRLVANSGSGVYQAALSYR